MYAVEHQGCTLTGTGEGGAVALRAGLSKV